ncbi:hypothetical protein [Aurantiacibacter aquimixticola]|uniref:Uncharacterized protein n=1 Tax=Aurantiacibacter aquimixticola TaxID=1958945 RepID=A0A419RSJ0_9SPHN|nr:hypothetical protein [Aurantiacibacter aquimixticola]RJY08751.1 hypothetical protein D6201_04710 [Aurantiacibacter aquimixticola]
MAGIALGCGVVLVGLGFVSYGQPWYGEGAQGSVVAISYAAPGVLMLGLLFTVPSALALVFTITGIHRDVGDMLAPWKWAVGGLLAAVPTAWLFGAIFREDLFDFPSVHLVLLVFGAISGLAARIGYREVPAEINGAKAETIRS